jgi:hypothetical protein
MGEACYGRTTITQLESVKKNTSPQDLIERRFNPLFRRKLIRYSDDPGRMIVNPLLGQLQPVLLRLLSCFETPTGDPFNLDDRAELTGNTEDA